MLSKISFSLSVCRGVNRKGFTTDKNSSNNVTSFGGYRHISEVGKSFRDSIKIIFSDIDGTISPHSDLLSKKTVEAVNMLRDRKVPVVLTTARCYKDTLAISEQFAQNPDFTIVLQGGSIVNKNGDNLFRNNISQKVSRKLVNWVKSLRKNDKNLHLIMYFDEQPYSLSKIQFPWKTNFPIIKVTSFDELFDSGMQLHKAILYRQNAKVDNFDSTNVLDTFQKINIKELELKPSGTGLFELQNKWVSKDKALDFLLRVLKIDPKNAMVIGDSSNDIEMMDFIRRRKGLAVAMGNAEDYVKQHANAITTSIAQDGFSHAIGSIFSEIV